MKLSHTSRTGVTLHHIAGYNVTLKRNVSFWQHRSPDGAQVGPQYPTKAEALADTCDYVRRAGWEAS
jgi:hypothetical protein